MIDLEAFFSQNEIYDIKTIMSEQRLEGKFIFFVSTPFSLVIIVGGTQLYKKNGGAQF